MSFFVSLLRQNPETMKKAIISTGIAVVLMASCGIAPQLTVQPRRYQKGLFVHVTKKYHKVRAERVQAEAPMMRAASLDLTHIWLEDMERATASLRPMLSLTNKEKKAVARSRKAEKAIRVQRQPAAQATDITYSEEEVARNLDFAATESSSRDWVSTLLPEPPLGIPSFIWGFCLGVVGILIVYLTTEDTEEAKKALLGCVIANALWLILYLVLWGAVFASAAAA